MQTVRELDHPRRASPLLYGKLLASSVDRAAEAVVNHYRLAFPTLIDSHLGADSQVAVSNKVITFGTGKRDPLGAMLWLKYGIQPR
jgi:hypothetical protein